GIVAARGFAATSIITTPNMTWVPKFAIAHSEITTYTDGRWGIHEYSRWPQAFSRDIFHVHCIPAKPRTSGPGPVCWRTLRPSDWQVDNCGITNVGFLEVILHSELISEGLNAISRYTKCRRSGTGWDKIGDFLVVCLSHVMDRLRYIPAPPNMVIALAAHVQRLTLELYGMVEWLTVVMDRVATKEFCCRDILEIIGAHTSDASEADMLYRAGIPVWFEQHAREQVEVYKVVEAVDVPPDFSRVPCVPRLVLAKRDLSGALNMPGEWERAMGDVVRRQLCGAGLPALLEAEADGTLPPAKRLREGAVFLGQDSSSIGPATPAFVVKNRRDVKTLGHHLPPAPLPPTSRPGDHQSRRAKARAAKRAEAGPSTSSPSPLINPSRRFYRSQSITLNDIWETALVRAGSLPQPRASVKYYFAPPWLLDSLSGLDCNAGKTARYLHQWVAIRTFCRTRLFDGSIQGRPLTVSEWRHALWGDYAVDDDGGTEPAAPPAGGRGKQRRELKLALRQLFGTTASLPSYNASATPTYGKVVVTESDARHNQWLRRCLVYDAYETNWRCELLALDALMLNSHGWSEAQRWAREYMASRVWGEGTSGLDVMPDEGHLSACEWCLPPDVGWEECRPYMQAFVEVLSGWPGCPQAVRHAVRDLEAFHGGEYTRVVAAAVDFYVSTFVAKYGRLPVPPARINVLVDV
ncbi:hypothetical protein C8T65DRAFT_588538, partial [Cerioporus squamosus]